LTSTFLITRYGPIFNEHTQYRGLKRHDASACHCSITRDYNYVFTNIQPIHRLEMTSFILTEVRPNREKKGQPARQWLTLMLAIAIARLMHLV